MLHVRVKWAALLSGLLFLAFITGFALLRTPPA